MLPFGGMANFPSALPVRTQSDGLLGTITGIALPLHRFRLSFFFRDFILNANWWLVSADMHFS